MSHALWILDLDGVIWRGRSPVEGSAGAVERLQSSGATVVFATNNSAMTPEAFEERLAGHGIDAQGHVVTSSQAAATLLVEGESVLMIGDDGVRTAIESAGAHIVEKGPADAVVVGITRTFDYHQMKTAARALHGGARLIATNLDATFPTANGLDPGNGSLVAAVSTAGGVEPIVAGKPHTAIAQLVLSRYGETGIVVGDRADTDGRFAVEMGYDFALVLSGVLGPEDLPVDPAPSHVAADLAALVEDLL